MMNDLLFLIGPRGSGKSSVAAHLAALLGWACVDADAVLEERAGKTIRAIFAEDGELAFRDLESAVLADLCCQLRCVIATGGGVVLREENRRLLRQSGLVVWLNADVDTLWSRINADVSSVQRRPNLAGGGREEVASLVALREPLYRQCAHHAIDTTGRTPQEVADAVLASWRIYLTGGSGE